MSKIVILFLGLPSKSLALSVGGMFQFLPMGSTYGILTYVCHQNQPNVGQHTRNGSFGLTE